MTTPYVPESRTSCTRCHKRKKRCDRLLPSCQNCQAARTRCSFQDTNRGASVSYPLSYVRNLEAQLAAVRKQLASEGGRPAGDLPPESAEGVDVPADAEMHSPSPSISSLLAAASQTDGRPSHAPTQAPAETPSFAQELKDLTLEATAERHLGSSSGLAFAKLTQMILCRLTPDKADFVFTNDMTVVSSRNTSNAFESAPRIRQTNTPHTNLGHGFGYAGSVEPTMMDFNSPSDLFNSSSVLNSLSDSISVYPLLFGDVFLSDIMEPAASLADLPWPPPAMCDDGVGDEDHVALLVNFYFAHSNTLYPIVERHTFMATLGQMQSDPARAAAGALSPLDLFRVWMVLAIGSTAFSSVSLADESEPMLYYNKALQYAEEALAMNEMAALEVLTLQVSYSFFNQLGPNTWFLVGMAARVALGCGLHTASTYDKLPTDVAEQRKRIFFSIYMMDRVASMALGRPFALHDDDIDVEPFAASDGPSISPNSTGIDASDLALQPSLLSVPLHILALRQIASRIARQVYSPSASRLATAAAAAEKPANNGTNHVPLASPSSASRQIILTSLHQELVEWRRTMPFPLPDLDSRVPHLSSTWYDFNFYTHLASLYRPSPLFPVMDTQRVKILANAAAMALRHAFSLHQQQRLAYNWLNFLSIFTVSLSLIYATTAQPSNLATVLRQTRAIDDLELAVELFEKFGIKFAAARKIRSMVAEIVARYRDVRGTG
ncbi:hypothetical protein SCUCBS95973_008118 [Sporothrix curviconia]|uniref:Zn(2)-C6 fungal-type domain-containing protein n=1 Tax=Sporothrix curviconia TaxID=1260050 RepID=A0ABP0CIT8_9PEZI